MKGFRKLAVAFAAAALATMIVAPAVSNAGLLGNSIQWKTLKAPAPSWYTDALHQRVLAAGPRGVPLPAEAAIPTSSLTFLGIRPGQLIILSGGSLCTSNFVFTNGAGEFFIGTAGHCGNVGEQVTMLYLPGGLVDIGNVVLSTGDAGIGHDFALIKIKPELYGDVSPSLAYWGGPTGVYGGSGPAVVQHAGWGLVVGTGGTPRVGLGLDWGPNAWRFESVITPGDSGSAAIVLGGQAAGNITHIAVDGSLFPPVFMAGTSMTKILQIAGGYQLATCSAISWPLPGCP
ncbi:MAG: hypothetical protein WEB06_03045 [Actinomycetota bacterium]